MTRVREVKIANKIVCVLICVFQSACSNSPVVLWHGMGDSCCNPLSIGYARKLIKEVIPNIYVHSIEIGDNPIDDTVNSFFVDTNKKISLACDIIKNDPKLSNGYHAVGFSQGSQFLRAVAQRCPDPPMLNLISLGGQHQGVYGKIAIIFKDNSEMLIIVLRRPALLHEWIRRNIVQAAYWHDPYNQETYRKFNTFIADINQEKGFNEDYKNNLMKLKAFVLVKFEKDMMIIPRESQWFGFFDKDNPGKLIKMEETALYFNDTLGLRTLDNLGKIHRIAINTGHLELDRNWFIDNIIEPFLKDNQTKQK